MSGNNHIFHFFKTSILWLENTKLQVKLAKVNWNVNDKMFTYARSNVFNKISQKNKFW